MAMRIGEFAEAMLSYCNATNGRVTSWIRTREHNLKIEGAADGSFHQLGLACDVVYGTNKPGLTTRKTLAKRVGLLIIDESDHDHLQPLY